MRDGATIRLEPLSAYAHVDAMTTETLFGLALRWRTSFDWRVGGALPPRPLGSVIAARAGTHVVGLAPADGSLLWKTRVQDVGMDGFLFSTHDGLAITNWRNDLTRGSHVVAIDEAGVARWDVELPGPVGLGVKAMDDGTIVSPVLGQTWQLAIVDTRGRLELLPLPTTGSVVARASDGAWIVGAAATVAGHAALYRLADGQVVEGGDAPDAVSALDCAGNTLVTNEHTDKELALVGRELDLSVRWRHELLRPGMVVLGDRIIITTGDLDRPVPTCVDLQTGATRWTAAPLPDRLSAIAGAENLLLLRHDEGATLIDGDGGLVGEFDGMVGRDFCVTDQALYLFANQAAVCLELP